MRIDKFLQVSRIIKRRAIAKEAIVNNRVFINEKQAKPSSNIQINDIVTIEYNEFSLKILVKSINGKTNKDKAEDMFEIICKE